MPFPHRKFREKRESLGLSRAEVATVAGLAPRYMELLEQGKRPNPTHDTIEGLCRAIGVTCDFFFSADLPASPPPPVGRPPKSEVAELEEKARAMMAKKGAAKGRKKPATPRPAPGAAGSRSSRRP